MSFRRRTLSSGATTYFLHMYGARRLMRRTMLSPWTSVISPKKRLDALRLLAAKVALALAGAHHFATTGYFEPF